MNILQSSCNLALQLPYIMAFHNSIFLAISGFCLTNIFGYTNFKKKEEGNKIVG